jgi:hypothetical protein
MASDIAVAHFQFCVAPIEGSLQWLKPNSFRADTAGLKPGPPNAPFV